MAVSLSEEWQIRGLTLILHDFDIQKSHFVTKSRSKKGSEFIYHYLMPWWPFLTIKTWQKHSSTHILHDFDIPKTIFVTKSWSIKDSGFRIHTPLSQALDELFYKPETWFDTCKQWSWSPKTNFEVTIILVPWVGTHPRYRCPAPHQIHTYFTQLSKWSRILVSKNKKNHHCK